MDGATLVAAIGVALLLEGLLPLIAPQRWRQVVSQLMQLKDGQLRFYGAFSVVLGLIALLFSLA
ncbi:DUF2065 domain-containing protein [Ottowia sp. GY511]|uniref:DUF2065 family protein n=1 Tax=Ottowia flava TaxID=2675430 RepID=A0ABW4KRS5_9BURK|nr:DUF2065 domain-containing protein [Ottowia sp. GY511]TXK33658.1 DUF2065 domain-containing protein [Ottowia sp. GY511]